MKIITLLQCPQVVKVVQLIMQPIIAWILCTLQTIHNPLVSKDARKAQRQNKQVMIVTFELQLFVAVVNICDILDLEGRISNVVKCFDISKQILGQFFQWHWNKGLTYHSVTRVLSKTEETTVAEIKLYLYYLEIS